jgi:hypothetical protein
MPASKNLPAILDPEKGKKQQRKSVGVRVPDDVICRAVLEDFGGCLLSHSVHVPEHLDAETGGSGVGCGVGGVGGAYRAKTHAAGNGSNRYWNCNHPPPFTEVPDPGTLIDMYGNTGIDFIVDTGPRVATASTVSSVAGGGGAGEGGARGLTACLTEVASSGVGDGSVV